jgi:site-specific recombinase XerD
VKATKDKQSGKWLIIVPPSVTGTGKRQRLFFDTKFAAETKARLIKEQGFEPTKHIESGDLTLLALIKKQFGNDAAELIRNLDFARKTIGGIPAEKRIDLETACSAFIERQRKENRNRRTIYSDRQALKYLCQFAGRGLPLIEVSETRLNEYFDTMQPGGRRRTQHSRLKKFFNWCSQSGYLVVNPMEKMKPREKWNSNREILDIEAYRRILFVIAGLEPMNADDVPTLRYLRLLPFYVLGGMAGLRRREIISSDPRDPVIEWTDIWWKRELIEIRDEVAKQVGLTDHKRYPPLEPAAKEWLEMVAKPSGRIVEISQSTFQRLNDELLDAVQLEVPENGLRNSYGSYALSFRTLGEVSKAMGDNEATTSRYYIKKLEPNTGQSWFAVRPGMRQKVVPADV